MIDFGLAHSIDEVPMTDSCGTLYYAAPEVLRGHVAVALWGCPMADPQATGVSILTWSDWDSSSAITIDSQLQRISVHEML